MWGKSCFEIMDQTGVPVAIPEDGANVTLGWPRGRGTHHPMLTVLGLLCWMWQDVPFAR